MRTYPIIVYPTEFSKMRRTIVRTPTELNKLISLNNYHTDCFATVYQSRRLVKPTTVDRLFYDFDEGTHPIIEDNPLCYSEIIKLHEKLDYNHRIHYSGRGFHCFIYTEPFCEDDNTTKNLLVACHNHIKSFGIHPDDRVKDIARMFRIPNTWNPDGSRFCIPLDEDMLYSGYNNIRELAKTPSNKFTVFGSELFDLTTVDYIEPPKPERITVDVITADSKFLLPCAQYVMNMAHPDHYQKVAFVAELKKLFSLGQLCDKETLITEIENFIWKNCKWIDLNNTTITKQNIECAIDKIDFGYSCKSKRELGICVENCQFGDIKY